MKKIVAGLGAAVLASYGLFGQTAPRPAFEVASVKLVAPQTRGDRRGCTGGPGTSNPGTWTCPHVSLAGLIYAAYDLELYEFVAPEWMTTTWVAIAAKVPVGTTKEQFCKMQQGLLEERFNLAFHRQPKQMTVYDVVLAKNGLKMRESAPDAPAAEVEWSRVPGSAIGQDRYPVFPAGANGLMGVNGHMRWRSPNVTMADIVRILRGEMGSDVVDRTGLKGKYDVDISWQQRPIEYFPSAPPFDGPAIDKAIEDRLGLKLESRKGATGIVVIDHIDRAPIEN